MAGMEFMEKINHLRIDGHTMRFFVSVCETRSLSRTADIFNLNQSTISHTLDKMRSAIGDPLFLRSGRGITPTDKAIAIVPRIQTILAELEGLATQEKYDGSIDKRPIILAISTPALLNEMRALHSLITEVSSDIRLEIRRLAPRSRIEEMLTQEEAELAIAVSGHRYPSILNSCHYRDESPAVFWDPNCRPPVQTLEDYASARHGVVNFGGNVRSEVEKSLEKLGLKRTILIVAPTASMLGDLIIGTDLIITMPERLGNTVYHGLAQAPPPIDLPKISYDLVWHRRFEHSGRNKWLRQLALSVANI
jgi:LysR family transcriptional activator of mexEF-oprN operon